MADALSHLHRVVSKDACTLESEWVLVKSGEEKKTESFLSLCMYHSEITCLYQRKPKHKINKYFVGFLGFYNNTVLTGLQNLLAHYLNHLF